MPTPRRTDALVQAFADAHNAPGGTASSAAVAVGMTVGSAASLKADAITRGMIDPSARDWKPVRRTISTDAHDNVTATHLVEKPDTGQCAPEPLPGFAVARRTIHRVGGEVVQSWEQEKPEAAKLVDGLRIFMDTLVVPVRGMAPVTAPPLGTDDDLLVVYPMGDPHFGLYAWGAETGDDFDLVEAERVTCAAIDRLVATAPNASEATLLNLGDFFHADDSTNATPGHGNKLDVDTRYAKVMQVGAKAMRWCVLRLLEKHQHVRVRNVRGNHDPHAAFALAMALDAYFENEPRVTIDMSPAAHSFQVFGKVLIGECHGDMTKPADLPGVMMTDAEAHISSTRFRHWHCGHVHHDSIKEYPGCTVETHQTLAGKDAWHAAKGYRSRRSMKAVTYHREFGEVHRSRCDIAMLRDAA